VRALRDEGVEVVFLDRVAPDRPKSCSPRDSVIPRAKQTLTRVLAALKDSKG
jgi:hypothetical protein